MLYHAVCELYFSKTGKIQISEYGYTYHTHTHTERKERSAHYRALEVDLVSNTCVIALSLNFFNPKMEITLTTS